MSWQQDKNSRHLAAYIAGTYGSDQLGLLRLLTSFPYFREAAAGNSLHKLLGMPLISFEKVLREREGIYYKRENTADGLGVSVFNGERKAHYADDVLSSVTGFVVGRLRETYTKYESFCSSPCVVAGPGVGTDIAVNNFDHDRLENLLRDPAQSDEWREYLGADIVDNYCNAYAMVDDPVEKYKVIEFAHQILVKMRLQYPSFYQGAKGDNLPFATDAELGSVMMGFIRRSVKKPRGGFKPKVLDLLKESHADGDLDEQGDFILSDTQTVFAMLGIPETPEFDPEALPLVQSRPSPRVVVAHPGPARPSTSFLGEGTAHGAEGGVDLEETDPMVVAALDLVDKYKDRDFNSLTPEERVCSLFGTQNGKTAWCSLSRGFRDGLNGRMVAGPQPGAMYIVQLTRLFRQKLTLDTAELCLLSAGRFVAWKGQYRFGPDGVWTKER